MAREFTAKEAKQLIRAYQDLAHNIEQAANATEEYKTQVSHDITSMLAYGIISEIIAQELTSGISVTPADSDPYNALITSLYKFIFAAPRSKKAVEDFSEMDTYCSKAIDNLAAGTKNSLQWLFTSSASKQAATKAYSQLQNAMRVENIQSFQETVDFIKNLDDAEFDTVFDDFESRRPFYRSALLYILPDILNARYGTHTISELLQRYNNCLGRLKDIYEAEEKQAKDRILKAVNNYLLHETLSVLAGISVEELARAKSGLRVKALMDDGYKTVKDIYTATASTLSFTKGISWEAAHQIKNLASDYYERARANIKIRLSSDSKTPQASQLILAIYQYRKEQNFITASRKLGEFFQKSNTVHAKNLGFVGNGVNWLFFSEKQKDAVENSYRSVHSFLRTYEPEANNLVNEFSQIEAILPADGWRDFDANSIAYYNILEAIVPDLLGNNDNIYGLPEELAREIQEQDFFPDGLSCELRRYQEWGVKYILHQERALLGDEMGLGKTVQAIATMVSLRNTGATHFMVVCPASVLPNWCKEIVQKSKLRVTKVHGQDKRKALKDWVKTGGVAVTTYETAGTLPLEDAFRYSLLIVDEAHYIKNPDAKRTNGVKKLSQHAERMLFMTGTALENNTDEMINLIDMLQPAVAREAKPLTFMSSAPQFREKVAPVYYRRKREQVLTELPDLIETQEWCTLAGQEESLYEDAVLHKRYAEARRVSWNVDNLDNSSKARRMVELINEAEEDGRRILIFSFFLDTIHKICEYLGTRCWGPITGSTDIQKRQDIINDFDTAPPGSVLVAQITSGGTGLNIQAASVVILCEPQFKPSIENQAISRAYRMGQARNVLVYRLLCEESVDERLTEMLANKQAIFDAFADKSFAADMTTKQEAAIDDKTFGKIIEEEIQRIKEKHERGKKI